MDQDMHAVSIHQDWYMYMFAQYLLTLQNYTAIIIVDYTYGVESVKVTLQPVYSLLKL